MATYGVGGDISLHLDTYGKPDQPHEELIDFDSGMNGKTQICH
jgi:hypothetical protein